LIFAVKILVPVLNYVKDARFETGGSVPSPVENDSLPG
jgi:hypothetical protein